MFAASCAAIVFAIVRFSCLVLLVFAALVFSRAAADVASYAHGAGLRATRWAILV